MKSNNIKIFKWIVNLTLILGIFIVIVGGLYNKFYINGNNENNIKRSISKLQNKDNKDFTSISITKTIELDNNLVVIYKDGFNCGVAEFNKNNWGDYKINILHSGNLDEVNFYLINGLNYKNQYFVVYGYGNNIDYSKVDLGINNNYISINIPEDEFVEIINITKYNNENSYRYNYKYYDKNGKVVKEY